MIRTYSISTFSEEMKSNSWKRMAMTTLPTLPTTQSSRSFLDWISKRDIWKADSARFLSCITIYMSKVRSKHPIAINGARKEHRDASLIFIACEGEQTERQYFSFNCLKNSRVKLIIIPSDGKSAPSYVLDNLKSLLAQCWWISANTVWWHYHIRKTEVTLSCNVVVPDNRASVYLTLAVNY